MREIRFRVWCNDRKQWERHEHVLSQNGKLYQLKNMLHVSKNNHIIEQFTGLKDSNGVDIYEGDIVKQTIGYDFYVGTVIWFDCSFNLSFPSILENLEDLIGTLNVVGNIHENPELVGAE